MENRKDNNGYNIIKKYLLFSIVFVAFVLFGICPLVNMLPEVAEYWHKSPWIVKEDAIVWFDFWVSFSGIVASMVTGLVAIIVTTRIEKEQRRIAFMDTMRNVRIENFKLRKDIMPCEYECYFSKRCTYMMEFVLSPGIPCYYTVKVTNIGFCFENESMSKEEAIAKDNFSIVRNEKMEVRIIEDTQKQDNSKGSWDKMYRLFPESEGRIIDFPKNRIVNVKLCLFCEDNSTKEKYNICLDIRLFAEGLQSEDDSCVRDKDKNYMSFKVRDINIDSK